MDSQLNVGDIVTMKGGPGPRMTVIGTWSDNHVVLSWFNRKSTGEYELLTRTLPVGALNRAVFEEDYK